MERSGIGHDDDGIIIHVIIHTIQQLMMGPLALETKDKQEEEEEEHDDDDTLDLLTTISLYVMDHDEGENNPDGFLGFASIPLVPLLHGKEVESELELRDEDGYYSPRGYGSLSIVIQ